MITRTSASRVAMTGGVRRPLVAAVLLSMALVALSSCNSGYGGGGSNYPTGPGGGSTGGGTVRELDSGDFGAGGTFQHRFFTAGTYGYHCIHHSPMTGSVQVVASATDTVVNVAITSSSMSFPGASVKPGGRVIWTNNTGVVHTVTSN